MEIHPFAQQQAILDSKARFIAAIAGVQGGKTQTGCLWLIQEIIKHPHDDFLIAAPTYKILEQSTLKKFFSIFPMRTVIYRKQDAVLEIIHGGKIYIRSTEIPNNIEGMTVRAAWLDEAGMMKSQVWVNVQGRVAIKRGRVLFTTTPYNLGWLYKDVVRAAQGGDEDFQVVKWRSVDNPYFPPDEYEKAKSRLSEADFDRRYNGEFRKMEGLVYPDWDSEQMIESSLPDDAEVKEVICGVDYGFTNPAAMHPIVIMKNDDLHVVDEVYQTRMTVNDVVGEARGLKEKWNISAFYVDPSANDLIEQLNMAGLTAMPANNDVEYGIGRVRHLIKSRRLKVWFAAYNLLDEIENYHYTASSYAGSELSPEFRDKPDKSFDHAVDDLRYAVATHPLEIYNFPATQAEERKERFWGDIAERIEKRKININRYGEDFSDDDIEAIQTIFG